MSYNILFLVAVSCLLVGLGGSDVVSDAIEQGQNAYDKSKDYVEGNSTADRADPASPEEPSDLLLNNNNGLTNTADDNVDNTLTEVNYDDNMNNDKQINGVTWCWECTIQKTLDNQVVSMWDEVLHEKISSGVCKDYQCAAGLDWCLVTHFRVRSAQGGAESKRERHECGNKNQRERDTRCQLLLQEDKDHQVIDSCTTKRSGASSIYTVYISAFIAALLLYVH